MSEIAAGLVFVLLLLAFVAYSDKVGHDDHPPPTPPDWWDGDDEIDHD